MAQNASGKNHDNDHHHNHNHLGPMFEFLGRRSLGLCGRAGMDKHEKHSYLEKKQVFHERERDSQPRGSAGHFWLSIGGLGPLLVPMLPILGHF